MRAVTVLIDDDAATRAAAEIAARLVEAVEARGEAALAVSGGSSDALFVALAGTSLPWDRVGVWQVDERVAPDRHPDRNLNLLDGFPAPLHAMPVTARDLRAAAAEYASTLPAHFDVVHLGVGPDGHTASWPPGDEVITSTRPVDLSGEYQGRVRMTLTPPVIDAARARVVLATGAAKAGVLARWLGGDTSLPIARVPDDSTIVVLDPAAAAELDQGAGDAPPSGASGT